mmetsp:Transcript_10589/g.23363  ORF Transcript_10589/g.23363 Transcript_10589/m.23363 type:complete len:236 (-) Transcript_10589:218-925(-)
MEHSAGAELSSPLRASTAPNPSLLGLSHVKRSPKWTFGGRSVNAKEDMAPGPGSYDSPVLANLSRFNQTPRYAFGLSSRENAIRNRNPGPGSYQTPRTPGTVGSGKSYSLTPRRNVGGSDRPTPGPGSHEIPTGIGTGPKYSTSAKAPESKIRLQPGPGDYERSDNAPASPRWGFGKALRPDPNGSGASPGPGSYSLHSSLGAGPRFSIKARHNPLRTQPTPGPGAHGGHYSSFG